MSNNSTIANQKNNETNNQNISRIPLKIKPIKSPAKIKKRNIQISSTIKIIVVLLLLLTNFFLIIHISFKIDENNKYTPIISSNIPKEILTSAQTIGNWVTSLEGMFSFHDDETFYWYDSYKYKNDNYFTGTYTYKKGNEALEEMGYSEEEFHLTFGEGYTIDNVFSMYLIPSKFIQSGQDLSSSVITEGKTWWFILIIKNDNTAIAYNKTLDKHYNLVRN